MEQNNNPEKPVDKINLYKKKFSNFFKKTKTELNKANVFSDLSEKKWEVSVNISLYSIILPVVIVIVTLLTLVTVLAWLPNLFNSSHQITMWIMVLAGIFAYIANIYRNSEKNKNVIAVRVKMHDLLDQLTEIELKLSEKKLTATEEKLWQNKFNLVKEIVYTQINSPEAAQIIQADPESQIYVDKIQDIVTNFT